MTLQSSSSLSKPLIREARANELDTVAAVVLSAYGAHRDETPSQIFDELIADLRRGSTSSVDYRIFVAELGGTVVGAIWFYPDASREGRGLPDTWSGFRYFSVLPQAQGHSVGRLILAHCIELSQSLGKRAFSVHTLESMRAAGHLYERLGFHRRPDLDISSLAEQLGVDPGDGDAAGLAYVLPLSEKSSPLGDAADSTSKFTARSD